jgi:hypothetical protein
MSRDWNVVQCLNYLRVRSRQVRVTLGIVIQSNMSESKSFDVKVPDPEFNNGESTPYTDNEAERSYVKKIDYIVLPVLCLVSIFFSRLESETIANERDKMYFFDCMDRVRIQTSLVPDHCSQN